MSDTALTETERTMYGWTVCGEWVTSESGVLAIIASRAEEQPARALLLEDCDGYDVPHAEHAYDYEGPWKFCTGEPR